MSGRTSQIDAIPAALDAMVDYFCGAIEDPELFRAVRGWPERNQAIALVEEGDGRGSVLAVLAGDAPIELVDPKLIDKEDTAAGGLRCTYRVGYLAINGTLDLWCTHRAVRDDMGRHLRETFHNRIPRTSDLEIDSTRYSSRPLKISVSGGRLVDDQDSIARGEWRQIWDFTLASDIIAVIEQPKLTSVVIRTTITDSGIAVTEPDFTVS